jgi:hypothetical protein
MKQSIASSLFGAVSIMLLMIPAWAQAGRSHSNAHPSSAAPIANSWRGITPLKSTAEDVSQLIGIDPDSQGPESGPYRVEGGEVTFSFLTPNLAKIYKAPHWMIGKVFTIYFKPDAPMTRSELNLPRGFKQCRGAQGRHYYYFVSDAGVAYEVRTGDDTVERVIYQPSRAEIRRLAVDAECVF